MSGSLVEVTGLRKYFLVAGGATLHAVDGVDVAVDEGQTVGLVGESGCGKTTTGRCILRLVEPDAGRVLFRGEDVLAYDKKRLKLMRRQMQIVFQDPFSSLDPRKTVGQIVAEPLRIHKFGSPGDIKDRVVSLLEQVGLSRDFLTKFPHELDGGRCQRVGIARALALGPKFVVCDEPVSALDVSIQAQILNLLMDLQERMQLAYLFISHNLAVVKHVSGRIEVMYLGKIIESAPTEELFREPLHPYTQALLSAVPVPEVRARRERVLLTGDVPTPINPGPGCRFKGRCKLANDRCKEETPALVEVGSLHKVACFRAGSPAEGAGGGRAS